MCGCNSKCGGGQPRGETPCVCVCVCDSQAEDGRPLKLSRGGGAVACMWLLHGRHGASPWLNSAPTKTWDAGAAKHPMQAANCSSVHRTVARPARCHLHAVRALCETATPMHLPNSVGADGLNVLHFADASVHVQLGCSHATAPFAAQHTQPSTKPTCNHANQAHMQQIMTC